MTKEKEEKFISAVVYIYNNTTEITDFLNGIYTFLQKHFLNFEIICVNDASTDDSVEKVKNFSKKISGQCLTLINMSFYHGLESAMNAGIDLAIGDFIFEFDSVIIDYGFSTVMDVYSRSLDNFDIVTAHNDKNNFFSSLFYKLYNSNINGKYKLNTETFRLLSRRAINRVQTMNKTVPYRKAIYANSGLRMDAIEYKSVNKLKRSFTKDQCKNREETAINTLILFTNIAYKLSTTMAIIMMMATFVGIIYTLIVFLLQKPVAGYTTIMLILTGSFFGVFAILAIVIKYLSIIVDLIFKKQKYLIESIEKIF